MERIVVGVDGSPTARLALRWAATEASCRHARVDAVMAWSYPVPIVGSLPDPDDADHRTEAALHRILVEEGLVVEASADETSTVGDRPPVHALVRRGPAGPALLEAAGVASMLVVGSRGLGWFSGMVLGSVSRHCATLARQPVVVVPDSAEVRPSWTRVVVGIDGSGASRIALRWALNEARLHGAALDVVYVWHHLEADYLSGVKVRAELASAADELLAKVLVDEGLRSSDVEVNPVAVEGPPTTMLLETARGADLLVLGARGRDGFAGMLLGSVAQHAAGRATCPVAVVRHPATG
jgi:nucleotide-binding universal stress UspA family protein